MLTFVLTVFFRLGKKFIIRATKMLKAEAQQELQCQTRSVWVSFFSSCYVSSFTGIGMQPPISGMPTKVDSYVSNFGARAAISLCNFRFCDLIINLRIKKKRSFHNRPAYACADGMILSLLQHFSSPLIFTVNIYSAVLSIQGS